MARRGLGRGLGALISAREAVPAQTEHEHVAPAAPAEPIEALRDGLMDLPVDRIVPSPWQPRKVFDEERLAELAQSIREQGLVQPVVVRQAGDRYELIAGERRFRAIQRLGWANVRGILMDASDDRIRELALVENLQRDDLNPLEIAHAYEALRKDLGLTHERIADRLGISRAQITNTLRLLDLPEEVRSLVAGGELPASAARALLALPEALSQIDLARRVVAESLSVRDVERIVGESTGRLKPQKPEKKPEPEPAPRDPYLRDIEDRLRDHLGTKVRVQGQDGKGSITIEYYSPAEATRILQRIGLSLD